MADKISDPPLPDQQVKMRVIDPNGAPIIYFEGAPNFGNNNGIINITLAAARHMLDGDEVTFDAVAVAFLRCNIPAALALRDALEKALLIGAPIQGEAN